MMKKVFYLFLCGVFSLAGCDSDFSHEEMNVQTTLFPIQFTVQMEKEMLPFPSTRSMPDNTLPEPSFPTKGEESDAELNELCSTIEYVVYKQEAGGSVLTKRKQFVYDPYDLDADFGCVYDSLPHGNYTFYFIAHNSKTANLSDTVFSFDSITDTFYETLPLEIGVAEEVNKSITLQRVVSRIEFMATDTVHDRLKQFDMTIEGRSTQLDLLSGAGIQSASRETIAHQFVEEEVGEENKPHGFFTFVPSANSKISVRLSATAHNDELLRERLVNNITPEKNKIIRYRGRLYSRSESDDTFIVSIYENGEWEEIKEEWLPEYD